MKKLFNKSQGNPLILALVIPAIVPMALGFSIWITLSILVASTFIAVILNKGLWKGDLIYIIIAYLIVILGYSFPEFFNAIV